MRVEYINNYVAAQSVDNFSLVPVEQHSALAKRMMNILHMNRGGKAEIVNVGKKGDPKRTAEIMFALDTLWKLGYTNEIISVKKGDHIWRRIRRDNSTGTYAIMQCSQKLEVTANYRVMFIYPPKDSTGKNLLTDSFHPSIYMKGNDWHFAHTGGSPFVGGKTLDFHPWDEPYPTYKQDGILIEMEQNPNH